MPQLPNYILSSYEEICIVINNVNDAKIQIRTKQY